MTTRSIRSRPLSRWIGLLMAMHFAIICIIKTQLGLADEIWWMSHIALAIGATGLMLRRPTLTATALCCVLVPHALWLFDAACGLLIGHFPFGITAYLVDATGSMWIATAHHFYLAPVLYISLLRERANSDAALLLAMVLTLIALTVSRFGLPAAFNVNQAHQAVPAWSAQLIRWTDDLPAVPFIVGVFAWTIIAFLLPAALIVRHLSSPPICKRAA